MPMNAFKNFYKLILITLFAMLLPAVALPQTCSTGKVDERVAGFLKKQKAEQTMAQLKATSIDKLRNDAPEGFMKLPDDSVKRIKITKDNIRVNVVRHGTKNNLPVIINYHQGGFILPLLPWMEYEALRMAKKFNAVVFDIDYRVAPEFKFPAASNDASNAFVWVSEHASEYGGDPSKIILTGSGTGATLAALVAGKAKKEGKLKPIKLVVLNCPATDNPMISFYDSYEDNAKGYLSTKDMAVFLFQTYLDKSEWFKNNPEAWPIYEKDLTGMPPSLIITTEFDVFRDEGIAYGKKLEQAGNSVSIKCYPHQIHCFSGLPQEAEERMRVYELMGEAISKATSSGK